MAWQVTAQKITWHYPNDAVVQKNIDPPYPNSAHENTNWSSFVSQKVYCEPYGTTDSDGPRESVTINSITTDFTFLFTKNFDSAKITSEEFNILWTGIAQELNLRSLTGYSNQNTFKNIIQKTDFDNLIGDIKLCYDFDINNFVSKNYDAKESISYINAPEVTSVVGSTDQLQSWSNSTTYKVDNTDNLAKFQVNKDAIDELYKGYNNGGTYTYQAGNFRTGYSNMTIDQFEEYANQNTLPSYGKVRGNQDIGNYFDFNSKTVVSTNLEKVDKTEMQTKIAQSSNLYTLYGLEADDRKLDYVLKQFQKLASHCICNCNYCTCFGDEARCGCYSVQADHFHHSRDWWGYDQTYCYAYAIF